MIKVQKSEGKEGGGDQKASGGKSTQMGVVATGLTSVQAFCTHHTSESHPETCEYFYWQISGEEGSLVL